MTDELPLLAVGEAVDLDNCAREPIHIPGSIQPRGVLLVVREPELIITQISANSQALLGVRPDEVLQQPLSAALGELAATTVSRAAQAFGDLRDRNPHEVLLQVDGESRAMDVILHRVAGTGRLVVELEPAYGPRPFSFPNTYLAVRSAVADLNRTADLAQLYEITADAVGRLTGFDRVMVYRYDHEFNGEVVAEVKQDGLNSFLGLHYPASDIPAQARALYEKNWIRLISDVAYQPAALVPAIDPLTDAPLDLTLSTLRSVSPIHIEYLQNMGVTASMSISLLRDGRLWGLIACHHYSGPHAPTYGVRAAAEFLGSTLSLRLVDRAQDEELRRNLRAQSVLATLTAATLDETEPMVRSLLDTPSLLDLIPADSVVVTAEGFTETRGDAPDAATVLAVARWAETSGDELVATDSLVRSAPGLAIAPAVASGVLALPLPKGQYVIWFRREVLQSVDWGGDPRNKDIAVIEGDGVRLSPRRSFERWSEVVESRSLPWTQDELDLAAELRRHVVEALYVRSQRELRLAETLQRSLLPALPQPAGWTLTARYETAEGGQIGGDWYDAFVLRDGRLVLVLGDVAGHGIAAAGAMAQLRNALRAQLFADLSPAQALAQLNDFTTWLLPGAFATAVLVCLDTRTGEVTVATAGHPRPYVAGPAGRVTMAQVPISPALGITGVTYRESEFVLEAGQALVLYSDGLIERRDEHIDVGFGRLAEVLAKSQGELSASQVFAGVVSAGAHDDTTVLVAVREQT